MNGQLASVALAIGSVVAYQICMKIVPESLNPINVLVTFYVSALVFTLAAARFLPVDAPSWTLSEFSWVAVGVGIAIVGIELGFLLMYRSGWHVGLAPLVVMGGAAILLMPVAIFVFGQAWTPRFLVGIVLCMYGLYLLAPQEA